MKVLEAIGSTYRNLRLVILVFVQNKNKYKVKNRLHQMWKQIEALIDMKTYNLLTETGEIYPKVIIH